MAEFGQAQSFPANTSEKTLAKGPVEASIVGADQVSLVDQASQRRYVDDRTFDHLVADIGKPGNFCRDETRGLAKAAMDVRHVTNCAVFVESEGDDAHSTISSLR